MSHIGETFFTAVGCMDGRSECTVAQWGREKFGVLYADAITEAGLVGILSQGSVDPRLLESIKKKILISVDKHHSKNVVVSGHEDCAGNPVDEETHKTHIRRSVQKIQELTNSSVPVVGVYVKRGKSGWEVEEL